MCGIFGVFNLARRQAPERTWLQGMGDLIVHRGPDDAGVHMAETGAIGMRRLSIIDVSGGHQPIANEDGSLHVVCNGEIYNFREIRAELQAKGHVFRTGSDTEIIVHLYEEEGDDFVNRLEGMFGFALWDNRRKRLLIGRDRLGIKPLYLLRVGDWLGFASEAKSFLALPFFRPALSEAALSDYLSLGYVAGGQSMFADVTRLPAGSLLTLDEGACRIRKYWTIPQHRPATYGSRQEAMVALRDTLSSAVTRQMVSDVPLGAFLSGGMDSSSVVAFMARHSDQPIRTYAIGYDGGPVGRLYNELPYAREVARHFRTQHQEIIVRPDVASLLPKLIWHMDEPVADSAMLTTYLVSDFASRDVKVILSGVGGDELLGGYNRYLGEHYVSRMAQLPRWFRAGVLRPLTELLPSDRHSKLLNLFRYARSVVAASDLSPELRYQSLLRICSDRQIQALRNGRTAASMTLADLYRDVPAGDWLYKVMAVDLQSQLCDDLLAMTDRMTMATSIECRVPLLDESLVNFAATIPAKWTIHGSGLKALMKDAMAPLLPREVITRSKRGFGAPFGAWLRTELSPLIDTLLGPQSVERRGIFDPAAVSAMIEEHRARRHDNSDILLALLSLEMWSKLYLDRASLADVTEEVRIAVERETRSSYGLTG